MGFWPLIGTHFVLQINNKETTHAQILRFFHLQNSEKGNENLQINLTTI